MLMKLENQKHKLSEMHKAAIRLDKFDAIVSRNLDNFGFKD